MTRLLLATCLLASGCDGSLYERAHRPPEYKQVRVILYQPAETHGAGQHTRMLIKPHTIVEDESGIRYRVLNKVGEPGDQFKLDVSQLSEVNQ